MLKVATALPNEPYREYKDVERVYSGSTEIDKILDKNGNVLFAVNKEVEGTPAITYKGKEETNLKNYRIYGQTIDGESVGDRTGNLFDVSTITLGCYINDEGQIIQNDDINTSDFIKVSPNTNYTYKGAVIYDANIIRIAYYDQSKNFISRYFTPGNAANGETVTTPSNCEYVKLSYDNAITNLMFNLGFTALPYEPYGYKVPVTVEGKNLFDFDAFVSSIIEARSGTISVQGQTITLTASKTDCYTYPYLGDQSGVYKVPVLPNTKYVLSWEADNNKDGRIYVFLNGSLSSAQTVLQTEKSIKFITRDDTIYATIRFGVYLAGNSITYSNIQLNKGSTPLPYEPYHAPITTPIYLPEQIKMVGDEAEYIDYAEQKLHRVRKNLLENTAKSRTINGVTFTVNSDGSVTCNGKCVNNVAVLYIKRPTTFYDETIQYTLTGCPVGGAYNSTYALEYTNSVNQAKPDVGNGVSFTPYRKEFFPNACIRIVIFVGYTCDNLTFYPMIRKADIEDDTYEPYIENTELDVTLPALPVLSGTNTLTVGTEVQPSNVYLKGRIKEIT